MKHSELENRYSLYRSGDGGGDARPAVAAYPHAELVGVFDPARARAKVIAKSFGGEVFGSLKEALYHPRVAAVHVLTPVERHVEAALAGSMRESTFWSRSLLPGAQPS